MQTPWMAAHQASLSFTISQSLLKLMSIELVMPSNHLTIWLGAAFSSFLQSLAASGSFLVNLFFTSGGQSIEFSASTSVLPMNIQDWFLLGLTGLISLLSKELSGIFCGTQFESISSSVLTFFMVWLSRVCMTTGKTVAVTIQTFVSKVISLLFHILSSFVIAFLPRS